LRKETIIRLVSAAPFPVISFGPYPSPEELTAALARAIGTCCLLCWLTFASSVWMLHFNYLLMGNSVTDFFVSLRFG
jgi:hypothetical protein